MEVRVEVTCWFCFLSSFYSFFFLNPRYYCCCVSSRHQTVTFLSLDWILLSDVLAGCCGASVAVSFLA